MTHRAQLLILALLIVLLLVFALFPRSAASDVPVVAGAVPAGEFVPVKGGLNTGDLLAATATPGATPSLNHSARSRAIAEEVQAGIAVSPPGHPPSPSPSASSVPPATPVRIPAPIVRAVAVTGTASWFASPRGVSAAGPALRTALGPGWRGTRVHVTGPAGSAVTVLGDWMAADRLIDLDDDVFPAVCGPLSKGICGVEVTW